MENERRQFSLFLSFAEGDEKLAVQIIRAFTDGHLACWWDRQLRAQMDEAHWDQEIQHRIVECQAFILLVADNLMAKGGSSYCLKELEIAEAQRKRIFVISTKAFKDFDRASFWHHYIGENKHHVDTLDALSQFIGKVGAYLTDLTTNRLAHLAIDLERLPRPAAIQAAIKAQAEFLHIAPTLRVPLNTEPQSEIRLLFVPSGECRMGSDLRMVATALRRAELTAPFFIAANLVSNRLWSAVHSMAPPSSGADLAHTGITRDEAKLFCRALTEKTGLTFSLPTERQWEFAARLFVAAHGSPIPRANVRSGDNPADPCSVFDLRFAASGLVHILGECWEWVEDDFEVSTHGSAPGVPITMGTVRGGSRAVISEDATLLSRRWFDVRDRDEHIGFRPVLQFDAGRPDVIRDVMAA